MRNFRNSVQLIGRIGNDLELKEVGDGKKLLKLSLATNDTYKNAQGEKVTETQWHNVVVWGKPAEVLYKYSHKGAEIGVEGKLVTRSYEDKQGMKRYITEVLANDVALLGKSDK
jgi:single-strand DNA-binding protein